MTELHLGSIPLDAVKLIYKLDQSLLNEVELIYLLSQTDAVKLIYITDQYLLDAVWLSYISDQNLWMQQLT